MGPFSKYSISGWTTHSQIKSSWKVSTTGWTWKMEQLCQNSFCNTVLFINEILYLTIWQPPPPHPLHTLFYPLVSTTPFCTLSYWSMDQYNNNIFSMWEYTTLERWLPKVHLLNNDILKCLINTFEGRVHTPKHKGAKPLIYAIPSIFAILSVGCLLIE